MTAEKNSAILVVSLQVIGKNSMTKRIRVLVADNQPRARQSMKALLGAWYQVEAVCEANNGSEALQIVEVFQPNLILMDARMPKMNGLEALKRIKAKWPAIKIIVLSMYPDFKTEALEAGADAFVSKSDPPEKLREVLKDIISGME
jgi:DNA-binding NarL/FixJ family response regulator